MSNKASEIVVPILAGAAVLGTIGLGAWGGPKVYRHFFPRSALTMAKDSPAYKAAVEFINATIVEANNVQGNGNVGGVLSNFNINVKKNYTTDNELSYSDMMEYNTGSTVTYKIRDKKEKEEHDVVLEIGYWDDENGLPVKAADMTDFTGKMYAIAEITIDGQTFDLTKENWKEEAEETLSFSSSSSAAPRSADTTQAEQTFTVKGAT